MGRVWPPKLQKKQIRENIWAWFGPRFVLRQLFRTSKKQNNLFLVFRVRVSTIKLHQQSDASHATRVALAPLDSSLMRNSSQSKNSRQLIRTIYWWKLTLWSKTVLIRAIRSIFFLQTLIRTISSSPLRSKQEVTTNIYRFLSKILSGKNHNFLRNIKTTILAL